MDTNMQNTPKITKESKNKIRVEFDRTPLKERLKAKFLNLYFFQQVAWIIFRMVLLVGISYVVLFPFISKIAGSFMSPEDFVDVTVRLIPKNFTLDIYKAVLFELDYWDAFLHTFIIPLGGGLLQTFSCCLIAYGLAKFRFRGNTLVMLLVILTMIVPHQTLQLSLFMNFRYFDIFGIIQAITGSKISLLNTNWPLYLLSLTGLAYKNGLFIFLMRQFYQNIPNELCEAARIDGAGNWTVMLKIIMPMAKNTFFTVMLINFITFWNDYQTPLVYLPSYPTLALGMYRMSYVTINELSTVPMRMTAAIFMLIPTLVLFACFHKRLLGNLTVGGIKG